ncbi:MAG: HAMP domain-containing histidine kinase, partial [Deltaproteobacteria bacterium]|nr:HAMP domain-containing histidine kinase [Deltaproteobacteria bacterium]
VLEEEIESPYQGFVSNIMRNAMRLRSLIDDMLNLKYLESGVASLAQDKLNLLDAVQQMVQDVSLLAEEKQLDIEINIPDNFPEMTVDRQKFDLILVNLIHNAVKFTPAGGQITFQSNVNGDNAVMSVHNTGTTIPQKQIDRIFERFYQVESSLTREHGGAGLGLAIVRGMTEVCGGEISVESSKKNGTTFTVTLPLDNSHLEARKLLL